MRAQGEKQVLDRKIRQIPVDLPQLETELHLRKNGSAKRLIESKIARMEAILDELQKDDWLSRNIDRHPELAERIKATREVVETVKVQVENIEEGK